MSIVASTLDAPPSRCLVVLSCRLLLSRHASWLSHHHLSSSARCTALSSSHHARHDDGRHGNGKRQQGDRWHDDGDGQHDDGKGQQGDRRHDDGDGRHDDGGHDDGRHDDAVTNGGAVELGSLMGFVRSRQRHNTEKSLPSFPSVSVGKIPRKYDRYRTEIPSRDATLVFEGGLIRAIEDSKAYRSVHRLTFVISPFPNHHEHGSCEKGIARKLSLNSFRSFSGDKLQDQDQVRDSALYDYPIKHSHSNMHFDRS